MALEARIIERIDDVAAQADAWDALVVSRRTQADLYDTATWLCAWHRTAPDDDARALRVVAAFEGERLVAALPLLLRAQGAWQIAGFGFRPRYRVVVAGESTSAHTEPALAAMAEALGRAGVRALELPVMPERDPATAAFARALESAGFSITKRPGTHECLTTVNAAPWDEHRRRFKKFERTVKNFSNKAERLGPLALTAYGVPGGPPARDGFAAYVALHGRGWKGAIKNQTRAHREALIEATSARGWARLFTLSVAGVPAASIVWFRLGEALFAYSTVYEAQLYALSAGTIAMWRAHEELFAEGPVALIDYLPGKGAQKDQLGEERDALVTIEAARKTLVGPFAAKLAESARRALGAAMRAIANDDEDDASDEANAATLVSATIVAGEAPPLAPFELEGRGELFLACAAGHKSASRMRETWIEGDTWWTLGAPPFAFVRLSLDRMPRELVLVAGTHDVAPVANALASALGRSWDASVVVRHALLPW